MLNMKRFTLFFLLLLPRLVSGGEWLPQVFDLSGKGRLILNDWDILRSGEDDPELVLKQETGWMPLPMWTAFPDNDPRATGGEFWLKTTLKLTGKLDRRDTLSFFFIKLPSAFTLYWDGKIIERNGSTGSDQKTEKPGKLRGIIRMASDMAVPGQHTVLFHVSNHHVRNRVHDFSVYFRYYSSNLLSVGYRKEENLIYIGLFLTVLLFSLFLFLGGWRYYPAIFFCLFTIFRLLDEIWAYLMRTDTVDVTFYYRFNPVVLSFTAISFLCIFAFFTWHLEIPGKKLIAVSLSFLASLRLFLLFFTHWYFWQIDSFLAVLFLILILLQVKRKKSGSATALIAHVAIMMNSLFFLLAPKVKLFSFINLPYYSLFLSSVFFIGMMGSITIKMREQIRAYDALQHRSQRLEAELLKKSIQPHFIMNTLLSVKSLFSVDSRKAERLIEALADEFRLINRISGETEIPLQEEIELCRLHLEIMGYRREAQYEMNVSGDCRNIKIPPLIIHTLVENGLTHSFGPRENGTFHFSCRREAGEVAMRLENDGTGLDAMNSSSRERVEEGMGMRYIRARLSETYGDNWRLKYGLEKGVWFVEITLVMA